MNCKYTIEELNYDKDLVATCGVGIDSSKLKNKLYCLNCGDMLENHTPRKNPFRKYHSDHNDYVWYVVAGFILGMFTMKLAKN